MEKIKIPKILRSYFRFRTKIWAAAAGLMLLAIVFCAVLWSVRAHNVAHAQKLASDDSLSIKEAEYVTLPKGLYTISLRYSVSWQDTDVKYPNIRVMTDAEILDRHVRICTMDGNEFLIVFLKNSVNSSPDYSPETGNRYYQIRKIGRAEQQIPGIELYQYALYEVRKIPISSYFLLPGLPMLAISLYYMICYMMIFIAPRKSRTWQLIAAHCQQPQAVFEDLQTISVDIKGKHLITDQYIFIPKGFGIMIRPLSQLVWAFGINQLRRSRYGYNNHYYIQCLFDDETLMFPENFYIYKWTYFRCMEEEISDILSDIQMKHPQMLCGFSKKTLKEANQNFQEFCANIRRQSPEGLKAMQPELSEKAVIGEHGLMQ